MIIDSHIQNIVKKHKFINFDITEVNFIKGITPGTTAASHQLIDYELGNSICFAIESILYWNNANTEIDPSDLSLLLLPQLQLISDNKSEFIKAPVFSVSTLNMICSPLIYKFLCYAKGNLFLNHYNPTNSADTAYILTYHKLYLINPKK